MDNDLKLKYGIPKLKKYPMPDAEHVLSAIRFFNYVTPKYEDELAQNILKRIKEYGITDIHVGKDNRFSKWFNNKNQKEIEHVDITMPYIALAKDKTNLIHYGRLGMKWYQHKFGDYQYGAKYADGKEPSKLNLTLRQRRFQNPDGTLTDAGKAKVAKSNYGYLNPTREDIKKGKATERKKVSYKYGEDYLNTVEEPELPSKRGKAVWDKYKDKYAAAVLKDLKLVDNRKAREHVKAILRDIDASYVYSDPVFDRLFPGSEMTDYLNKRSRDAMNNRKKMINYKSEKVKDAVADIKKFLTTPILDTPVNKIESNTAANAKALQVLALLQSGRSF